jgi:hypothetical protein
MGLDLFEGLGAEDLRPPEPDWAAPWATDDESWVDELAAADPERVRSRAEILHDGEQAPVTPALIAELEDLSRSLAVEPQTFDDADRISLAVAWARVENAACARTTAAVAAFAGRFPHTADEPEAFAWTDVAAALRLGDGHAITLTDVSRQLHQRLPATVELFLRGDLTWDKVRRLAERTMTLSDEQCLRVEQRVLPRSTTGRWRGRSSESTRTVPRAGAAAPRRTSG